MNLEQRLEKINSVKDADRQRELAKAYIARLRSVAKKAGTLSEKLAMYEKVKAAEMVLKQLRLMAFDIEDAIAMGKKPASLLAA